jgi:limonene-1,2-epoxide hydrolase
MASIVSVRAMTTNDAPIDIVRRFCAAWSDSDIDALLEYFADDAVYHNIPVAPVTGRDAIRATIEGFTAAVDRIDFKVTNIAANGDVVMTERVDVFVTGERSIELPVMGTFEVAGGRIAAWRDYFDLNQFMAQVTAS